MCITSAFQGIRKVQRPLRAFRWAERGAGRLHSVYQERQRCFRPNRWAVTKDPPAANRNYGFHAFRTVDAARRWGKSKWLSEVELWEIRVAGWVAIHRTGYRASRMLLMRQVKEKR